MDAVISSLFAATLILGVGGIAGVDIHWLQAVGSFGIVFLYDALKSTTYS